ncbi:Hypothetical predicted protein, partial [Olea europaea subsp. europaea]
MAATEEASTVIPPPAKQTRSSRKRKLPKPTKPASKSAEDEMESMNTSEAETPKKLSDLNANHDANGYENGLDEMEEIRLDEARALDEESHLYLVDKSPKKTIVYPSIELQESKSISITKPAPFSDESEAVEERDA